MYVKYIHVHVHVCIVESFFSDFRIYLGIKGMIKQMSETYKYVVTLYICINLCISRVVDIKHIHFTQDIL